MSFDFNITSDACVKCGKCKPVCTIFSITSDETTSPRGFIDLLGAYKRGDLELDSNAKNIFESCFLCTNCVDVCPEKIPTDMIIEEVRSDLAQKFGLSWYKRLFFYLLRHRRIMDTAAYFGWVFQSCAFKIEEQQASMKSRFTLPILNVKAKLPRASKKSFLNTYPELTQNGGKRKVAIFIGCMANYAYTNIGDSLMKILERLEIDAFVPKKQLCCGAPAYFTGDYDTVMHLVKNNIEYFESWLEGVEAIIIPEATCSAMITHDWVTFLENRGEKELANRAKKIVEKTFLATYFLESKTHLNQLLAQKTKQSPLVTYHDPCHARKVQGVFKEPRKLLANNYTMTEMSDPNVCCGFGGVTMQSEKKHLSIAAGNIKSAMIAQTKADIVSAECSACRMQLVDNMERNGVETAFRNPIELIWDALQD